MGHETKRTKYAADKAYEGQVRANETNLQIMRDTNAANLQLAQQQNQWNVEQWQRENEYNSPANQMKLYKQAGLNPNLAQGGFQPSGEIQSAPLAIQTGTSVENPYKDAAPIMAQGESKIGMLSQMVKDSVSVAKGLAELKKVKAETNQIDTYTPLEAQMKSQSIIKITKENNWYDNITSAQWSKLLDEGNVLRNTLPVLKSNKDKIVSETALNRLEEGFKSKMNDILLNKGDAELKLLIRQIALTYKQEQVMSSEISKNYAAASVDNWKTTHGTDFPKAGGWDDRLVNEFISWATNNGEKNLFDVLKEWLQPQTYIRVMKMYNEIYQTRGYVTPNPPLTSVAP